MFVTVVLAVVLAVMVTMMPMVTVVFVRFLVFLLHFLSAAHLPDLLLHRQGGLGQLGALPGALIAGPQVAVTGHALVAVGGNSSLAQSGDGIRVID